MFYGTSHHFRFANCALVRHYHSANISPLTDGQLALTRTHIAGYRRTGGSGLSHPAFAGDVRLPHSRDSDRAACLWLDTRFAQYTPSCRVWRSIPDVQHRPGIQLDAPQIHASHRVWFRWRTSACHHAAGHGHRSSVRHGLARQPGIGRHTVHVIHRHRQQNAG
jgi:hypothetical protein